MMDIYISEEITTAIRETMKVYNITSDKLGNFFFDSASKTNTAIAAVAHGYSSFNATQGCLRGDSHIIDLISQASVLGEDK
jgi:hypothetical protein